MSVHKYKVLHLEKRKNSLSKRGPSFTEQLEAVLLVVWFYKELILCLILLVILGYMIPARLGGF